MESVDLMQMRHRSALQPSFEYGKVDTNVEENVWPMQQQTDAGRNPFEQFNEMAQKRQHERCEVGTGEAETPIPEYIFFLSTETNTDGANNSPESLSSQPEGKSYVPTDDTSTVASESIESIAPDVLQQGSFRKIQPKLNLNIFQDDLNQKNACGDGPQQSRQLHLVQGGTSPFEGLEVMGQAQTLNVGSRNQKKNDPANSGDGRSALPIQQHHQQQQASFLSASPPTENDVPVPSGPKYVQNTQTEVSRTNMQESEALVRSTQIRDNSSTANQQQHNPFDDFAAMNLGNIQSELERQKPPRSFNSMVQSPTERSMNAQTPQLPSVTQLVIDSDPLSGLTMGRTQLMNNSMTPKKAESETVDQTHTRRAQDESHLTFCGADRNVYTSSEENKVENQQARISQSQHQSSNHPAASPQYDYRIAQAAGAQATVQDNNDVDGFGGPRMGSSVQLTHGQTVANNTTTSLAANNHNAVLSGMNSFSLQPQQYQPLQKPFVPNETGTGNMFTNQKTQQEQQRKQQSRQHYSGPPSGCAQQEQQKATDTHYLGPSNGFLRQQPQQQQYLPFHHQQGIDKSAVNQAYNRNRLSAIPTSWEQMNIASQSQGNPLRWEEMNQTKSTQINWNPPEQYQQQQQSSDVYCHYGSNGFPQTTYGGQNYSRRSQAIPGWNDGENSPAPHVYTPVKRDTTADTYKERQMWSYENSSAYEQYDQYSSDYPEIGTNNAVEVYKSSMDVTRERGAGMTALHLLGEATGNYTSTEVRSPSLSVGLSAGFAAQQTAQQAAQKRYDEKKEKKRHMKMIYREHQRMISQPKPGLLAESSRKTINFRQGYDSDLEADKCKLDFEREKFAKKKALQLMSYTREFYS